MLAKVFSCAVVGLEGALVEVEVDIARGLPAFKIFGTPYHPVPRLLNELMKGILNQSYVLLRG